MILTCSNDRWLDGCSCCRCLWTNNYFTWEPWPCDPAAETEILLQIWCFPKLNFQPVVLSGGVFFSPDTGDTLAVGCFHRCAGESLDSTSPLPPKWNSCPQAFADRRRGPSFGMLSLNRRYQNPGVWNHGVVSHTCEINNTQGASRSALQESDSMETSSEKGSAQPPAPLVPEVPSMETTMSYMITCYYNDNKYYYDTHIYIYIYIYTWYNDDNNNNNDNPRWAEHGSHALFPTTVRIIVVVWNVTPLLPLALTRRFIVLFPHIPYSFLWCWRDKSLRFRGNHLSNTTCLTRAFFNTANNAANWNLAVKDK